MARVKDRLIFETKKMDAVSARKTNKEQKLRSKEAKSNKPIAVKVWTIGRMSIVTLTRRTETCRAARMASANGPTKSTVTADHAAGSSRTTRPRKTICPRTIPGVTLPVEPSTHRPCRRRKTIITIITTVTASEKEMGREQEPEQEPIGPVSDHEMPSGPAKRPGRYHTSYSRPPFYIVACPSDKQDYVTAKTS
jgi:hypothetical protein